MLTAIVFCVVGVLVISILLAILSVPFVIIGALLPWGLRIAGVVLLVKGALEKPLRWQSFLPAAGAFLLAAVIRWIF